jgi:hypothetical protein
MAAGRGALPCCPLICVEPPTVGIDLFRILFAP